MSGRRNEPIAIIGSACRFAGDTSSPSKLWQLLRDPVDLRREIPSDRFNADGFYHSDGAFHGHSDVQHAYFLDDDPAAFDTEFFGIKPVEAKAVDPQQRLLMEVAYETLESAGIPIQSLRGSDTSVYAGVMFHDYGSMLIRDYQEIPTYYATGTGKSVVANRISYFFDWRGPSITVDTACSSSLVAVHLAAQSLRSGESRMALACGTNLILSPEGFIIESKLHMLSPDGRSRMWDQRANGYARGEGVAAVVLKTLSAALEDGDHIQCIIRETGLNQDGATPGITMPSASAQEALIRSTYARAGLDILKPSDRPQFFEAHGTGTPAGDPIEAEAVYRAFYTASGQPLPEHLALSAGDPLYVGSIKTVIGHTEGTAGVASLVKISLALRHGIVPPNMLFDQLSDRVAPFYKNLEILRTAKPWPSVEGQPRRASINSYGFGGANAHAILESYNRNLKDHPTKPTFTPFVFSAFSDSSLRKSLAAYARYFEESQICDRLSSPHDLAWTLRSRRSVFPHRISFPASSLTDLRGSIIARLDETEDTRVSVGAVASISRAPNAGRRILAVFTGQGAQYPRMGAELIEKSPVARRIIQELESCLSEIPDANERPAWSLEKELLAGADASRVYEAECSQPLCTAVQILLVQLLSIAGIRFSAVVGHSSGEIAAAYAAGYLTARHAILIAYYRGLFVSRAANPNNSEVRGAMIAVGASSEDMSELVADSLFAGRVSIAANNSSSSITISGDDDAIEELELVLDDEDIFHRRLKVDKAYHSHHMLHCSSPYRESIRKLNIESLSPPEQPCTWYSSLHNGEAVDANIARSLGDTYWPDNMTHPVLFFEALSNALSNSYDLAMEVGPHPALAAPAMQTIREVLGKELPYHGVLSRGASAIDASSAALGFLWSNLDSGVIDLDKYERALSGLGDEHRFHLVEDLPTYQWNHQAKYWHEPRSLRKLLNRKNLVHPLLGDITPDSAPHHMRWRNLLRVSEMEWLSGHAVQAQIVFPAAGFLATAIEAARWISAEEATRLIEIFDFAIHQAVVFEQDDSSVEVLIEMAAISRQTQQAQSHIRAQFTYSAALNAQSDDLVLVASGSVVIQLGDPCLSLLPARSASVPHMVDVESERFYSALDDLGYNFQDRFRALSGLRRKRGRSSCLLKMQAPGNSRYASLLIHPAELDGILQSSMLAYSYPYDEELRTIHLPTTIRHIRVNPAALLDGISKRESQIEFVPVDASIDLESTTQQDTAFDQKTRGIVSNVSLYATRRTAHPHAAVQVHGACFKPFGGAAGEEDRRMYSHVQWVPYEPYGIQGAASLWEEELDHGIARLLERIATFYLRRFNRDIPLEHSARKASPTKWYLNYARHMMDILANSRPERERWENETLDSLMAASQPHMHLPDVQIMHLVGTQMPRVFEGETTMLEEFRADGSDILDRYYAEGLGIQTLAKWVGRAVKQLTDRNPHMNILEVGAGTGGATKAIFNRIGGSFLSYTYTDVSTGFFEIASEIFAPYRNKMIFKSLDLEKDPLEQGLVEGTYDLVVAFFVIHATDLERSLRNLRRLLKPGGQLIIGEGCETGTGVTPTGFIFGTLSGWWVGAGKGRDLSPLVSSEEWDRLLRANGFSGADAAPFISLGDIFHVFPIVTQAVDNYVSFLRKPLSTATLEGATIPSIQKLVLIGGETSRSLHLINGLESILRDFAKELHRFKNFEDERVELAQATIVCLTDLDRPFFEDITPERFYTYKEIFKSGNTILWITSGRTCDAPFSNMAEAFARVATHEIPDLTVQQIDLSDPEHAYPETIAEVLLRVHSTATQKRVDISWIFEPEIMVDGKGHQLVPRSRFIDDLNDRYTAGRHPFVREINVQANHTPFTLRPDCEDGYVLTESPRYEVDVGSPASSELLELRVTHSILSALKTPFGHRFLVLGAERRTGARYLTLTSSLSSDLKVSPENTYLCELELVTHEVKLTTIGAHLIALTVLQPLYKGQTLVVHNSSSVMAEAFAAQARKLGVHLVFTADASTKAPASWIRIPRYCGPDLDNAFVPPESTATFVGFTNHHVEHSENEATLMNRLKSSCQIMFSSESLFSAEASGGTSAGISALLGSWLYKAIMYASQQWGASKNAAVGVHSARLADLTRDFRHLDPLSVIDWTDPPSLPVYATRLDAGLMFKGSGSTYWIEGMSGALGISLADWMVRKGARNIVMSSRRPDIAPAWIASHKHIGATITVLACDVTNEKNLNDVYEQIYCMLPPIAGVIHGAMVLQDVSVQNMSFDQLINVLLPKVNGSMYLDRIFQKTDLDFFVLTSSLNTVIGSKGQANYAAANAFMCSLAGKRRKRGLRASVVNVGAIIGAGYMEREARRAWDRVAAQHYMMRLSEDDFVQSICEGIEASRLDSPHGWEISIGLNDVPFTATNRPDWSFEPKHAIFVRHQQAITEAANQGKAATSSTAYLRDLQSCKSQQEAYEVVKRAFAAMLRVVLQVNASDDNLMAAHGGDIGLDSLVSVDVRSWFLKNLQVGIPVLKIMSNTTMEALVRLAVETLPPELAPQLSILTPHEGVVPGSKTDTGSPTSRASHIETPPTTDEESSLRTDEIKVSAHNRTSEVDWEAESCPPDHLKNIPHNSEIPAPAKPPKIVVLTGATGLFGRNLLLHFLQQPNVEQVICIAIRNLARRLESGDLPPASSRVSYHEGDLAAPLLGLDSATATSIFNAADAVIHNAAETSHLKRYSEARPANVFSTTALARLCLPRRIPLHYVSSAGLAIFYGRPAFPPVSMRDARVLPAADGSLGYASTKFVCERLLERTHALYGGRWPVCIHRPSTIVREGADASGEKARLDWMHAMLHHARLNGSVPGIKRTRGALDLVLVRSACRDLAGAVMEGNRRISEGEVGYVHQVGDFVVPLDRLQDLARLDRARAEPLEVLPMGEWLEQALASGLHPAVAALIEALNETDGPDYPRLLKEVPIGDGKE